MKESPVPIQVRIVRARSVKIPVYREDLVLFY
jgi:hypothetical protein